MFPETGVFSERAGRGQHLPPSDLFIEQVASYIRLYQLIPPQSTILAAVSGGVDSRVLLHVLHRLSAEYHYDLIIAHYDHNLRGEESRGDAEFVAALARSYQLRLISKQAPDLRAVAQTSGSSLQAVARAFRLAFLDEIRRQQHAEMIAFGHTASDQAETVLMRLLRGAGTRGMRGMSPKTGTYVRPLLGSTREEIIQFARDVQLLWREDSSNSNVKYRRNAIRSSVMPVLAAINPSIAHTLARTATAFANDDDFFEEQVRSLSKSAHVSDKVGDMWIERPWLAQLHPSLASRLIALLVEKGRGPGERVSVESNHIFRLLHGLKSDTSRKKYCWPGRIAVTVGVTFIRFCFQPERRNTANEGWILTIPGDVELDDGRKIQARDVKRLEFENRTNQPSLAWLGGDFSGSALHVRFPRPGDRVQPLGYPSPTRLRRFFIAHKVAADERSFVPLVLHNNMILWIGGLRSCENGKVTAQTQRIIRLELLPRSTWGPP